MNIQFSHADARDSGPHGSSPFRGREVRPLVEHSQSRWVSAGEVTWYGEAYGLNLQATVIPWRAALGLR